MLRGNELWEAHTEKGLHKLGQRIADNTLLGSS